MIDSKKYADVCPDAVNRIYERELKNRGDAKEAEKAAKAKLHQLTGAFMTPDDMKRARACLRRYCEGDATALVDALKTHSSTRERLDEMEETYARTFAVTGEPARIVDLACGINPLWLGARGYVVNGWDVGGGQVRVVNEWAEALDWDVRASVCDLVRGMPDDSGDVTLMMKLLPVLETQEKGAGVALLRAVRGWALTTFPTRTLGGRQVGMEKNYSAWFETTAAETGAEIRARFLTRNELCYVTLHGDSQGVKPLGRGSGGGAPGGSPEEKE